MEFPVLDIQEQQVIKLKPFDYILDKKISIMYGYAALCVPTSLPYTNLSRCREHHCLSMFFVSF